jgi:vacuolar-type H+-ATPase subunit H
MAGRRTGTIMSVGAAGFPMPRLKDNAGGAPASELAGVAATIERVLAAEREAAAGLERTRVRGAERVAEARLEARRILERAEVLAQAIHARTERVAAARAAAQGRASTAQPPAEAEVAATVARVAALLTADDDD